MVLQYTNYTCIVPRELFAMLLDIFEQGDCVSFSVLLSAHPLQILHSYISRFMTKLFFRINIIIIHFLMINWLGSHDDELVTFWS